MKTKKLFAILLTLVMLVGLLPMTALAADDIRLALYFGNWEGNVMSPADHYTTEGWGGAPKNNNDLFPRLLINGEPTEIDPAALYVTDPTVAAVSPSEYPGAVHIEILSFGETTINYKHTDGNVYSIGTWGTLPNVAFYSKPEATEANFISSFTASEGNDTVYLIATNGITIKEITDSSFPSGTSFDFSDDKTMVTVKIGHGVARNMNVYANFSVLDGYGNHMDYWGADFTLNTAFPGLYFRTPAWLDIPEPDLTGETFDGYWDEPGTEETYFFYFFDGKEEILLTPAQLSSSDDKILRIGSHWQNDAATTLMGIDFGQANISYTHTDSKTYTLPVSFVLSDFGFSTAPTYTKESFIGNLDGFTVTEDNRTLYLAMGATAPEGTIVGANVTADNMGSFPEGTTYKIADDGQSIAITVGDLPMDHMYCTMTFDYHVSQWNQTDTHYVTIHLVNGMPHLSFYEAWFESDGPVVDDYSLSYIATTPTTLFMQPNLIIGGETIKLDPAKLTSTYDKILKVSVCPEAPELLVVELCGFGEADIEYTHTDGKMYSLHTACILPTTGLYSKPAATEENYILDPFTVSEGNDTIYLVSADGWSFQNLSVDGMPAGTTFTVSDDNTVATIKLGPVTSNGSYLINYNEVTPDGFDIGVVENGLELVNENLSIDKDSGLFFYYGLYNENGTLYPDESMQHFYWYTSPRPSNLYPMFTLGDAPVKVDPSKLVSADDSIVKVSVSEEDPAAVWLEFVGLGDTYISYTHTDGKTYTLPIKVMLPNVAFYATPEVSLDGFLYAFSLTEHSSNVYLVARNGITINSAVLENAPAGTTLEKTEDANIYMVRWSHDNPNPGTLYTMNAVLEISQDGSSNTMRTELKVTDNHDTGNVPQSNQCGDDLFWSLEDGVLTITANGVGSMMNNYEKGGAPWYEQRADIHTIKMTNGITIGNNAFYDLYNVTRIELPESLSYFENGFEGCDSLVEFDFPNGNENGFYVKDTIIYRNWFNEETGTEDTVVYAKAPCAGGAVILSEGVDAIHFRAFSGCDAMDRIVLPKSLQTILPGAFEGCTALKAVEYPGTAADWEKIGILSDDYMGSNDNLVNAPRHYLTYHDVVLSTCTTPGVAEHYECTECGVYYVTITYFEQSQWQLNFGGSHKWNRGVETSEGIVTNTCSACDVTKTEHVYNRTDPALYMYSSSEIYNPNGEPYKYLTWHTTPCNYDLSFVFFDGKDETVLRFSDLKSNNEQIAFVRMHMYDADMCNVIFSEEGTALVSYTHTDGKTYSVALTVGELSATPDCKGNHTWDSGVVTKEPTTEAEGIKTFTCTVCGETKTEAIEKLPPEIPDCKGNHTWNNGVTEQEATCAQKGLKRLTCTVCGETKAETIPMKDHAPTAIPGTAATCAASGLTEGSKCSVCGTVLTQQEIIPATGKHSYADGKCTVCGAEDPNGGKDPEPVVNPFNDVAQSDYYYAPVLWAVENQITGGIGDGQFGPNAGCTRGQVVTFLWAAAGRPEPKTTTNPFHDVAATDYFYKPVLWAVENEITGGIGDGLFGPNETCTRSQIVTFLWASQGKPAVSGTSTFSDVLDTDWFAKPVIWAAQNEVTGGIGNGLFGSYATCTRGQVVTFLYKVYK